MGLLAAFGAQLRQHRFQVRLVLDVHAQLFRRQRQNGHHLSGPGSLGTLLLEGRKGQNKNDLNYKTLVLSVNRYRIM